MGLSGAFGKIFDKNLFQSQLCNALTCLYSATAIQPAYCNVFFSFRKNVFWNLYCDQLGIQNLFCVVILYSGRAKVLPLEELSSWGVPVV